MNPADTLDTRPFPEEEVDHFREDGVPISSAGRPVDVAYAMTADPMLLLLETIERDGIDAGYAFVESLDVNGLPKVPE